MRAAVKNKLYYGWLIVVVSLISSAVLLGTRTSFGVFFKSIESEFEMSRTLTSGVLSAYMAIGAIFSLLGGWFLDRFGPKISLVLMGFLAGLSLLLTGQAQTVWQLYLTYSLLLASGTGGVYFITGAYVSRWFEKKRGLALGISSMGGGLGVLVAAPLASYLIVSFNWRTAFNVLGIITLIVVISLALWLKRSPEEIGLLPDGRQIVTSSNSEKTNNAVKPGLSLKETLATKQFWFLFLAWMFQSTAVHLILTHIVPHAIDSGISPVPAAGILSAIAGFSIIGGLLIGVLSQNSLRSKVSIACALMGSLALLWLIWMPGNIWLFNSFAAVFGISWMALSTMVSTLAGDIFGTRSIGKIMGWLGIAWCTGGIIGPIIGGSVFDVFGSYSISFLIGGLCMLITAVCFVMVYASKKSLSSKPV